MAIRQSMVFPAPLSLFCVLLLCLPLAIFFTITSPTTTIPTPATATAARGFSNDRVTISIKRPQNQSTDTNSNTTTTISTTTTTSIEDSPVAVPIPIPPKIKTPKRSRLPPPPLPAVAVARQLSKDVPVRMAAQVNPRLKSPKKIAFMFLTTTPLPFAPLWELYFNASHYDDYQYQRKKLFNIYIHADPRFKYDPPFSGVFSHRVIPHSEPAERGTPTLASAARLLLAHALRDDPSNSMFALLSPSCIPLHSFNFTYKFLTASDKSFIEILDKEAGAYDRWAARGADAMLPEVKLEDFRIGSQFWVLTRKHAGLVVRDKRIWAKFNQTCVRHDTCYPEENYFPTLIHIRGPRGSVTASLTHVDWNWSGRSSGHPRMYEPTEVGPDLITSLRNARPRYGDDDGKNGSDSSVTGRHDPFLFARKFSPDSLPPLMTMATDIIFKD